MLLVTRVLALQPPASKLFSGTILYKSLPAFIITRKAMQAAYILVYLYEHGYDIKAKRQIS